MREHPKTKICHHIIFRILNFKFLNRDVQMSGRARVVLKPTTKSLPLVGGFQMSFLERPNINFDLDGIADIYDWPILKRKVLILISFFRSLFLSLFSFLSFFLFSVLASFLMLPFLDLKFIVFVTHISKLAK